MNPKKRKKLSLNKTTISNLDRKFQGAVLGGDYSAPGDTCKTCPSQIKICIPTEHEMCQTTDTNAGCETFYATCDGLTCNVPESCTC